jgi:hypothetical protein
MKIPLLSFEKNNLMTFFKYMAHKIIQKRRTESGLQAS